MCDMTEYATNAIKERFLPKVDVMALRAAARFFLLVAGQLNSGNRGLAFRVFSCYVELTLLAL